jgi:uncharacterized membrane protein
VDLYTHGLDLLVHFDDASRLLFDGPAAFVGQVAQDHIVRHLSSSFKLIDFNETKPLELGVAFFCNYIIASFLFLCGYDIFMVQRPDQKRIRQTGMTTGMRFSAPDVSAVLVEIRLTGQAVFGIPSLILFCDIER